MARIGALDILAESHSWLVSLIILISAILHLVKE